MEASHHGGFRNHERVEERLTGNTMTEEHDADFDQLTNSGDGADAGGRKKRLTSASNSRLPLPSVLSAPEMQDAISNLRELTDVRVKISELAERQEELEMQLAAVCDLYNLPGLRYGKSYFEFMGWKARKNLNREALVALLTEYAVPIERLGECYKPGKEFLQKRSGVFDLE